MMKYVLILLAVLLLILLVCFLSSVKIRVKYDGQVFIKIKYLFFSFQVMPADKKRKKKKTDEKEKDKEKDAKKDDKPIYQKILDMKPVLSDIISAAGKLIKSIEITNFELIAKIASKDPSKTGMEYGMAAAATGTIIPIVENNFKVKRRRIEVNADFEGDIPEFFVDTTLKIIVIKAVIIALRLGIKIMKNKKAV